MAVTLIFAVLLVAVIPGHTCEPISGYNNGYGVTHFNDLQPPPPPLLPVIPVPFHRGVQLGSGLGSTSQRQNFDTGYHYQPPASQPAPALPAANANDFKFPAPFYKQYNFNFVPPPQPFTTTPSPSVFQKVSNWLFPSQEQTHSEIISNYNAATFKKDCNPCNLVPWIPVIRYDLAAKNQRNVNPTYGPPSPTASSDAFNSGHSLPQPFSNQNFEQNRNNIIQNNQHNIYGPPNLSHVASTYGPPSPTHIVEVSHHRPLTSPFAISSNSLSRFPYNIHSTTFNPLGFTQPASLSYSQPTSNGLPSSTISTSFALQNDKFFTTTSLPFLTQRPGVFNQQFPYQNDVEIISQNKPSQELQLPKVTQPTGFRNSYGEPIDNGYRNNLQYPPTATGAESSKVKTEVLPDNSITSQYVDNMSLALANPAPFTLNRGRNIHTLQPVALPNLSISPLPPIFNARPFRPVTPKYFGNILYGSNQKQSDSNNLHVAQSVPLAEYTHTIEYPATYIQSPIIDIDTIKSPDNQTKGYRNIQNSYVIDEVRDISPQASDHHISATKENPESSFESTGPDLGNDIYEGAIQSEFSPNKYIPQNHKPAFADLRGVKDEDVDKYRTESNLQHIDSPLLYLKPSAPHKSYENFFSSSSEKNKEYEIYDETPTTPIPVQSTPNIWDSSRTYFMEESSVPAAQQSTNQAKIVQIIVPYTINHKEFTDDNTFDTQQDFQGRKVHIENKNNFVTISTETYTRTTTEEPISTITDQYNSEILNTPAMLNDLYDVKEPPFDIIKLQHTIDDWTEQEYSNVNEAQKIRSSEKYAKQIPDNYFTTISPVTTYATELSKYNYDTYDHEFSSSNQYVVTDNKTNIFSKVNKGYNDIERTKVNYVSGKDDEEDERLHIYTAASTFRTTTTTTTPAPWGSIQTSISPLTNEKVYVVTSKPWRENQNNVFNRTQEFESFESKRTSAHSYVSSGEVVIKPPKSFHQSSSGSFHRNGFRIGEGRLNGTKFDSSYTYSNGWHRRINNLGDETHNKFTEDAEDILESQESKTDTTN